MIFKTIFTWWNRHTFGTFLKTLISGKYVGCDELGNKYYSNKAGERWVLYSKNVEATKITSNWYLWMHHTIDKIPNKNTEKKYFWQKDHQENKTGTDSRHSPVKIKKDSTQKKYETWK